MLGQMKIVRDTLAGFFTERSDCRTEPALAS